MTSSLVRRIAVAAVGIPAALGLVYLGGWWFAGTLSVLGAVGTWELYRLASAVNVRPLVGLGATGAVLLPMATYGSLSTGGGWDGSWLVLGIAVWLIAIMAVATGVRAPTDRPLAAVSITVFGALYAAGLPAFALMIRHPHPGESAVSSWGATWLLFLPLALTWACDTLAMAGGALFGGAKLAPVLSPKKTWSGALAGAGGALILAPLYGRLVLRNAGVTIDDWALVLVGLVVAVGGQTGDVAESLFKREAGVKDSGGFFPGHGGVLDRLDSLYWAVPGTALVLKLAGAI